MTIIITLNRVIPLQFMKKWPQKILYHICRRPLPLYLYHCDPNIPIHQHITIEIFRAFVILLWKIIWIRYYNYIYNYIYIYLSSWRKTLIIFYSIPHFNEYGYLKIIRIRRTSMWMKRHMPNSRQGKKLWQSITTTFLSMQSKRISMET